AADSRPSDPVAAGSGGVAGGSAMAARAPIAGAAAMEGGADD
ncbi:MAG: hypothetical protein JWN41_1113, partial [Thermoleophilia bacterium]|nr:hypothetical protein [Thermoleophilia bacterium]